MARKAIPSKAATVGPYSAGIDSDGLVLLSGQIPLDPATGRLVAGGVKEQTRQAFANAFAVLDGAGLAGDDVQKVCVYLTDMNDFAAMNEVYKDQFAEPYPARTTLGVSALPAGARVEIEITARKK